MNLLDELAVDSSPPVRRHGLPRRLFNAAWFLVSWSLVVAAAAALIAVAAIIVGPRVLGWQGLVVLSGSMEPALPTGGLAFVEPATPDQIAVGDILTYRSKQSARATVSHRVIGISEGPSGLIFQTKGDANTDPDSIPVEASQVVGKITFDVPYMGHVANKLRSRENYYLFIGIPAALLILNELWTVGSEFRQQRLKQRRDISQATEGVSS